MLINRLPHHIDILPVHIRTQQNLILGHLKQIIDLETPHSNNLKLTDEALPTIKTQPYLATFNTGKADYYLYCTRENNRQTTLLINRNLNRMWSIPSKFPDECYLDTLFEVTLLGVKNKPNTSTVNATESKDHIKKATGKTRQQDAPEFGTGDDIGILELEEKKSHFLVLISDLLVYQGRNLTGNIPLITSNEPVRKTKTKSKPTYEALPVRLGKLKKLFENYQYLKETFEYTLKPYVGYDYLESLWFDLRPKLNYQSAINGIYFRYIDGNPVKFNGVTNYYYHIPYWTRRPEKTVQLSDRNRPQHLSLLLEKTSVVDHYRLYAFDRYKNIKFVDVALVNDLVTSQKLQREMEDEIKVVYRCEWNEYFKKWRPIERQPEAQPDILCGP